MAAFFFLIKADTDKTKLSYIGKNAAAVGLNDIMFAVDRGFISEKLLRSLSTLAKAFTSGISVFSDVSAGLLKSHSQSIKR